jgi:hypothetical protein
VWGDPRRVCERESEAEREPQYLFTCTLDEMFSLNKLNERLTGSQTVKELAYDIVCSENLVRLCQRSHAFAVMKVGGLK